MVTEPRPETFTFDYLRTIHTRLFQRVLPFAGTIRDVDTQAGDAGIPYCRPDYITASLDTLFTKLAANNNLTGLDVDTFAAKLGDHWGELSAIHPFRDGNTRSQSAYVSALAEHAGHPIAWTRVNVNELRHLRLLAVTGNDGPLADYLKAVITSPGRRERVIFATPPPDTDVHRHH